MISPPVLRIEYFPPARKYQLLKYENSSPEVLAYAHSTPDLIGQLVSFLQKDYRQEYDISYSSIAWRSLTAQEKNILEGIVALHKQAVQNKNKELR